MGYGRGGVCIVKTYLTSCVGFLKVFFRHRVASIKSYEKNEVSTVERDLRRAESIVKKTL